MVAVILPFNVVSARVVPAVKLLPIAIVPVGALAAEFDELIAAEPDR